MAYLSSVTGRAQSIVISASARRASCFRSPLRRLSDFPAPARQPAARSRTHRARYLALALASLRNSRQVKQSLDAFPVWTPDRFPRWAGKIGPNTEGLISAVLASRPHPEQGFRTCLGILRSYRGLDTVRVEAVSARAVELGVLSCKGVASLLARKGDTAAAKESPATLFDHANLRGPGYYH